MDTWEPVVIDSLLELQWMTPEDEAELGLPYSISELYKALGEQWERLRPQPPQVNPEVTPTLYGY